MTTAAIVEVLKAHLAKEGLALCKANDTQFPLDGFKETNALTEIVELIEDTEFVSEWHDENSEITQPIPVAVLTALRAS